MRSIFVAVALAALALSVAGCGGSSHPSQPFVDPSVAMAGDDFRNGEVRSAIGTLAGENDQEIQFNAGAVRFHSDALGVDIAGYHGQKFVIAGHTYTLLVYDSQQEVALHGDAGEAFWHVTNPVGSG